MFPTDLSYDPRDPCFDVAGAPGLRVGVQVFTTENVYGLDPDRTTVNRSEGVAEIVATGLSWAGQQQRADGGVAVQARVLDDGGVAVAVSVRHSEPVKAVKVLLRGLPAEALDRGWWQMTSPPGSTRPARPGSPLLWRYPWPGEDPWPEWETPWACAGEGDPLAVTISVRDNSLRPVRLFDHLPLWADGDHVVEIVCEQDARRVTSHYESPTIIVRQLEGPRAARADALAHLDHMAAAHGVPEWGARPDVPPWFRDIRLVAALHGCHWTGYVFNTYVEMGDALEAITGSIDGRHVLAYLPGWEGRYYFDYPDYAPSELLGGADAFAALIERAHGLGVRVMPMFGVHGVNRARWPNWEASVLRTRSGHLPTLVNRPDWDGDRAGEDDQIFCNPGEPGFRDHLLGEILRTIETFPVDGVFLDTTGCWHNDARFSMLDGYRAVVDGIRSRRPDLLVAGEGWFDALLGVFPVNQSWHGVDKVFRVPEVLTRFGRALGHLSTASPGTGSTGAHELGFTDPAGPVVPAPGHLPALTVVDGTIRDHADAVAGICAAAAASEDS